MQGDATKAVLVLQGNAEANAWQLDSVLHGVAARGCSMRDAYQEQRAAGIDTQDV